MAPTASQEAEGASPSRSRKRRPASGAPMARATAAAKRRKRSRTVGDEGVTKKKRKVAQEALATDTEIEADELAAMVSTSSHGGLICSRKSVDPDSQVSTPTQEVEALRIEGKPLRCSSAPWLGCRTMSTGLLFRLGLAAAKKERVSMKNKKMCLQEKVSAADSASNQPEGDEEEEAAGTSPPNHIENEEDNSMERPTEEATVVAKEETVASEVKASRTDEKEEAAGTTPPNHIENEEDNSAQEDFTAEMKRPAEEATGVH